MRVGQIGHMDVVADRRAVPRRIIGAENLQRIAAAERGAHNERDQVGLGIVVFADVSRPDRRPPH